MNQRTYLVVFTSQDVEDAGQIQVFPRGDAFGASGGSALPGTARGLALAVERGAGRTLEEVQEAYPSFKGLQAVSKSLYLYNNMFLT